MQQVIIIGLVVLLPVALTFLLRTNAAMLFFVISAASLLRIYVDEDVTAVAGSLIPGNGQSLVTSGMLVAPVLIVLFAFKKTVKARHLPLHMLIALATGGALLFVLPSFLSESTAASLKDFGLWQDLQPFAATIIGAGFLLSVLAVWLSTPKHGHAGKHRH
jgi:hypothetical protein